MVNNVILRFDEENFKSSCIDGFKVNIKKSNITLEDIKIIRDRLREHDYCVKSFRLDGDDILEIEGGLISMPSVESMYQLVSGVEEEKYNLTKILYSLMFLNIEISIFVSGLY